MEIKLFKLSVITSALNGTSPYFLMHPKSPASLFFLHDSKFHLDVHKVG